MAERDKFESVSKSVLDIFSLVDVHNACKDCAVNWNPIGLQLRLSEPKLTEIAAVTTVPRERLQRVLVAWLQKDTIPGSPDPSYYTLCHAIETGGENPALANKIAAAHPAGDNFSDDDTMSNASDGYYTDEELNKLCSCGKCSLQTIITVGCPVIGEASSHRFPLLDIGQIPKGKKQQYMYMIEKETMAINETFDILCREICESMKNVSVIDLKAHLKRMRWFNKAVNERSLYDKLHQCEDVKSVFLVLVDICSWFNHHPLKSLVNQFGTNDVQDKYTDFTENTLMTFLKRSITEIPKDSLGDVIEGSGQFQLKMDTNASQFENIKGEHIYFLKGYVAEALEISLEHLKIVSFSKGCIEISFIVPREIYNELFPNLSVKQRKALQAISVQIEEELSMKVKLVENEESTIEIADDEHDNATTSVTKKESQLVLTENNHCGLDMWVLHEYIKRLSQTALPMDLVQLLYTEGVISRQILLNVQSLAGLLNDNGAKELCTKISENSVMLRVLGTVLQKSEGTVPLANDILRKCNLLALSSDTQVVMSFHSKLAYLTKGEPSPDIVMSTEKPDFKNQLGDTSLHGPYSPIVSSIRHLIVTGMPVAEVKKFLSFAFSEMSPQLSHADNADDVLRHVEENCSIDNMYCLETVIDCCEIETATLCKTALKEYQAKVDEFLEVTSIGDSLDVSFRLSSSPHFRLKCDTVEFQLSLEFLQRPLKEIKDLLLMFFNEFANRVLMESIDKQQEFIIVRCTAPHHLMNVLQLEAEGCTTNELKLKEMISLTVGYKIIFQNGNLTGTLNAKEVRTNMQKEPDKLKISQNFGKLLQSVGVAMDSQFVPVENTLYKEVTVDHKSLKHIITDPSITIKVRPVLVSFSGLPKSGKSMAFDFFVKECSNENPLMPSGMKDRPRTDEDMSHYDLIAAYYSEEKLCITEATRESSCVFGILSALKQHLVAEGKVSVLEENEVFQNPDLNEHLQFMHQCLAEPRTLFETLSNLSLSAMGARCRVS